MHNNIHQIFENFTIVSNTMTQLIIKSQIYSCLMPLAQHFSKANIVEITHLQMGLSRKL